MANELTIALGQFSDKGCKEVNQDFHGAYVPSNPHLTTKGIAMALADGISSSSVSQIASAAAVTGFLEDYYCTSETWSVKKSVYRVLTATNSWLHAQTQQSRYRFDKDRGYVCTFSAIILKSSTAHIFHIGDARIYRLRNQELEQLTEDHRVWVSSQTSYLSRALGINSHLEIDYKTVAVEQGDVFIAMTDGVYEFISDTQIIGSIELHEADLEQATQQIVRQALEQGSQDNLTIQIVRVETLSEMEAGEVFQQFNELPLPPVLEARMTLDGYEIIRELHASHRSHVYLVRDSETKQCLVLKTPSVDLQNDAEYLERFLMEEWAARRINSPYVLKPFDLTRKRNYLYIALEFIEGQTLKQWMIDHPQPGLETVRGIVEQIAKGLRAFHKLEMLHQDLRPDNIMIDSSGSVKIIDFGSTKIAGIMEISSPIERSNVLGTVQYTAPEYFLGRNGSTRSDLFSLGVIAYHMLCGRLPYGTQVVKCKTKAEQKRLSYYSLLHLELGIPAWIDDAIRKAVHPDPNKRYEELSEFIADLRRPNQTFLNKTRPPLLERNPEGFWKATSLLLMIVIVALLSK